MYTTLFPIPSNQCQAWKDAIWKWFSTCEGPKVWLEDSLPHIYPSHFKNYDLLLGCMPMEVASPRDIQSLKTSLEKEKAWWFGWLGYGFNTPENKVKPPNQDLSWWMKPGLVIHLKDDVLSITSGLKDFTTSQVLESIAFLLKEKSVNAMSLIQSRLPYWILGKEKYQARVEKIKEAVARGDVYQANLCDCLCWDQVTHFDPIDAYSTLRKEVGAPFGAYLFDGHEHMLCTSMERFMQKRENKLRVQPIKGTSGRDTSEINPHQSKFDLENDAKERAENIMIVDLMRNDLSASCIPGSIQVTELCKAYAFPGVHQMVSTVEGTLSAQVSGLDAIGNAWPPGSMTGAPKLSAISNLEELEYWNRGAYSGSIGYFTPDGDFDTNVVIRTLFYNPIQKTLRLPVGAGITYDSDPDQEWQELQAKSSRLRSVLGL